ncbi:MAG: AsmA family protein [Alphaproteobacteria bacterium]|nr:AsmA family protein [Alphaproteobacteria bacterium]
MRVRKNRFLPIVRLLILFVAVLGVAVVVALSQVDMASLRGNILNVLRDATGMQVEIDGDVSWKLSLRPRIELNKVRVANAQWAKNKNAFSAEKIDVRLNLISLFRDRPTIQNVRVYDAVLNVKKNADGQYSFERQGENKTVSSGNSKYPFKDMVLGGVEIKKLNANIFGKKYSLAGFNIRKSPRSQRREYSGWIKIDTDVFPYIVAFDEYNAERKIYPMQVAMSMGGDALIANIALEGTSKMPIDFIVKGQIPSLDAAGNLFGVNLSWMPDVRINAAGGFNRGKITLRKSSVKLGESELTVSGDYDWGKKNPVINAKIVSKNVDLTNMFPHAYDGNWIRPNRELYVFKNTPLYGKWFYNKVVNLDVRLDNFIVYRDLNLKNTNLTVKSRDNHARIDVGIDFADGHLDIGADADVESDGHIWAQVAALGERIYVGEILKQVHKTDFLSELPVNIELYVQTNGTNLSELMQTITGPVYVYSVAPGYAHSALVAYMYGTDFLTSLRHSIQDLFSSEKKYNQIKISCLALNAKLRDGVFETQNGFAIETNAINIRLGGSLDLGGEEMKLSLTTVPVRGLKLSLTGNVVNSVEFTGNLAEPNIKISGAAMAGKVASATGLGLLLAPFTGGIGLVAGTGVGLLAGDLLENWLADVHPCETAMERGAPLYRDDPEWMGLPMAELVNSVLSQE